MIDVATGNVIAMHVECHRFGSSFAIPTNELARDSRIVGTGIRFDGVARPSEHAYKEFWDKAEPAEVVPPEEPPRARAPGKGKVDLDEVRGLCASTFPDIDAFKAFLKANDYGEALRAVPPSVSQEAYRDGLLRALDRRNLIDEKFFKALRDAGGRTVEPADEPAVEAHAVAADEPSLLLSPRGTRQRPRRPGYRPM